MLMIGEPLSGIRVVEICIAVQGPAAALYLSDMGAEVIKVEPPQGDGSRFMRGYLNETPKDTISPQYVSVNRGKRSVAIDLGTELGRKAIFALLKTTDVLVTNYRDLAMIELGLGYDELKERFPRLIYASVNGFGPEGSDRDKAMLDGAAVARGGLASTSGSPDGPPMLSGAIIADFSGAMQLALGVMTALFTRERTGVAQRVQTSGLGSQLWLQQWELAHVAMTGSRIQRDGSHHPLIKGAYGIYPTKCGGAIMLAHTMAQEAWDEICVFADAPELAFDPRLNTPPKRLGNGLTADFSDEIRAKLERGFAAKTAEEWEGFLRGQPEAIWERVRDLHEVLEDEQNLANRYIETIDVPTFGESRVVGNLIALSETPGSTKGNPPLLGEGTADVLADVGLSAEEIEKIEARALERGDEIRAALAAADEGM